MERNFKKHLASKGIGTSQKIIGPIIADLQNIQIQMSETKFKKSASLFATKWQNHYDNEIQAKSSQMRDFLKYFEDNWIKKRSGWYEGYAQGYPSESNAIESNNRVLEDEQTMRVRMPVSQFIVETEELINEWATKRNTEVRHTDAKLWAVQPKLNLPDYTAARQWLKLEKDVQTLKKSPGSDHKVYVTPSHGTSKLTKAEATSWYIRYKQTLQEDTDFAAFKEFQSKNYLITISTTGYLEANVAVPFSPSITSVNML